MSSLLSQFVSKTDFESYEDFQDNFKILVPDNFNFAYDIVDRYAKECPEKRAMIWCDDQGNEKIFSFGDLKYYSDKAANLFSKYGIGKGDYVMLTLKSRYEFWFCILALHKLGAVAVPATHMLMTRDIVYRIEKANLKMIVCIAEDGVPERVDKAHAESENVSLVKALVGTSRKGWVDFRKELEEASPEFERPTGKAASCNEDISLVYFSSGTSGFPKMVEHDFTYPLGHILTASYWQNVEDNGLHYTVADSGWGKCVWGKLYGQWIAGCAVFVYDYGRFNAKNMLEKASHYGVTTFCAPPTVYRFLIKEDLSEYNFDSLNYAVVAGEPLNPEVFNRFLEFTGIKLMEGFGQTETVVSIATYPWLEPKPGSIGKPSPGFKIEIMDRDGRLCDVGEEGEIVINTKAGKPTGLFVRYGKDPEKTAKAWHEGYYHT
ncbi:MAG: AMP-binding protein, partial [Methanosarcinaceae archaeon]|nr:AMP-binding protein [Methanosarcinaceae archaeon]